MTTFFDRLIEQSHKMSPELVQELLGKYRNYATSTITKQGTILVTLILHGPASHEFENYIAQKFSAKILYVSEVAPIMTVEVHPEVVPELAAEEGVVKAYETPSIEPLFNPMSNVNKITLDEIKTALGVDKLHAMGYRGAGVNVALLDSGVDMEHPLIRGHLKGAYSVVDKEGDPNYLEDQLGHGSHTMSILAAFAPDADLYSYKIFRNDEGSIDQAMNAIEIATLRGSRIINASWGATRYDPIDLLVETIYSKHGTIVVSAAGNLGCIPGSEFVYTKDGPKPIKDVKVGDYVYSFSPSITLEDGKMGHKKRGLSEALSIQQVSAVMNKGTRQIFRVRTNTREVKATGNHPFLVLKRRKSLGRFYEYYFEWTPLEKLSVGDAVVMVNRLPDSNESTRRVNKDVLRILGCWFGDGSHTTGDVHNINFALPKGEMRDYYTKLIENNFNVTVQDEDDAIVCTSVDMGEFFIELGAFGKSTTRVIPEWIFNLSRDEILEFIGGYVDADVTDRFEPGHKKENNTIHTWRFEAHNRVLMEQFRFLCLIAGVRTGKICSRIRHTKFEKNGRKYEYSSVTYGFKCYPNSTKKSSSAGFKAYSFKASGNAKYLGIESVLSVVPWGEDMTYDIEVENTHSFVANGILVHNSDGVTSPARSTGAIAVGSVALRDPYPNAVASFSSRGPEVDIVALGGSEDEVVEGAKVGGGFAYFRGTSQATPEVSGIAACLYPVFGQATRDRLIESAIDLGLTGPDPESGFGLVNPVGALKGDLHWLSVYNERKNIPGEVATKVEFPLWPILGVGIVLAGVAWYGQMVPFNHQQPNKRCETRSRCQ